MVNESDRTPITKHHRTQNNNHNKRNIEKFLAKNTNKHINNRSISNQRNRDVPMHYHSATPVAVHRIAADMPCSTDWSQTNDSNQPPCKWHCSLLVLLCSAHWSHRPLVLSHVAWYVAFSTRSPPLKWIAQTMYSIKRNLRNTYRIHTHKHALLNMVGSLIGQLVLRYYSSHRMWTRR